MALVLSRNLPHRYLSHRQLHHLRQLPQLQQVVAATTMPVMGKGTMLLVANSPSITFGLLLAVCCCSGSICFEMT
jgi:predicted Na+-dependent transporter